jgi:predicted dehydrogenase
MPEQKINIGVIGTSGYADIMHLTSLRTHPGARLAAICGRNRERAEELARKHEISQVFSDYHEMIEKGSLDAVIVASPDDLHYPMTMAALDAGLHVLCEKPMALTVEHAQAMTEKAEAAGVVNMVMFSWHWSPHLRFVRQLVEEGQIGHCYHCDFRFIGGFGRNKQYLWRFDGERSIGILGDLGSHMIYVAHTLIGNIRRVSAHLSTFVERPGLDGRPLVPVNDSAMLNVEFENGVQGSIHLSAVAELGARRMQQQIILAGATGSIETDLSYHSQTVRAVRQGDKDFVDLPIPAHLWPEGDPALSFVEQWFALYHSQSIGSRLFVDVILENHRDVPNFRDGLQVQRVIEAALQAHQTGCWVSVG